MNNTNDEIEAAIKEVIDKLAADMTKRTNTLLKEALLKSNDYKMLMTLRNTLVEFSNHNNVHGFKACLSICKKHLNNSDVDWIADGLITELIDQPKNAAKFIKALIDAGLSINESFYHEAAGHNLIKQVIKMGCVPYKDIDTFRRVVKCWRDDDRSFLISHLLSCKKHRKSVIEASVVSFILGDGDDLLLVDDVSGKTYISQLSKRELFTALRDCAKTIDVLCVEYYELSDSSESYSSCSKNFFLDVVRRVTKLFSERFGSDSPDVDRARTLVRDRLAASAVAYELMKGGSQCTS